MRLRGAAHFFKHITEDAIFPLLLASDILKSSIKFIDVDTLGVDDFNFSRLELPVFLSNICFFLLFVKKV